MPRGKYGSNGLKVLVTGHNGYIGTILVPMLQRAGHDVVGLDSYLFEACVFGQNVPDIHALRMDIRDVEVSDLKPFDAVIHMAALSNDPLGDLNPQCTFDINHQASVRLASVAKQAGVSRFLYSSSCSLYGAAGEAMVTEEADFHPVTPYGVSKIRVEQDVRHLADAHFSPTFLRNATAYGVSPRLRADLVLNNLVGFAYTTGQVLLKSDGTAWRPLVHIEDIARAFVAVLHAPRELVHNQAFNVGRSDENYRIRDIADLVQEVVPDCKVTYAEGAEADTRSYRVDCSKLPGTLPTFQPQWTVRRGIEELLAAYRRYGLTLNEFLGTRYLRIKHVQQLQREERLDAALRWQSHPVHATSGDDHV